MADLEALYRDVVLDHNRRPRNFRRLAGPCGCTDGVNPLCGDRLMVCLRIEDETVTEAAFEGSGCAISMASASMMTEAVTGRSRAEALSLADTVGAMLRGREGSALEGELLALSAVSAYPSRVKCALLAWEALRAGLTDGAARVSTEAQGRTSEGRPAEQRQARDGH